MSGWINDVVHSLLGAVLGGITSAVAAGLNWVLGVLAVTVFATPDITALPQVVYTSGQARLVADACMGLVVTVAGVLAMGHGSVQDRYSAKELLPRLLIGFTLAHLALQIVRAAITVANAVTVAVLGTGVSAGDSLAQIRRILLGAAVNQDLSTWVAILQVLALVMLAVVEVTWLGRLTGLLVVAGVGPLALACHALPQSDPLARVWWRSLGSLLLVQVLQAVTLHLAVATLLTPGANLPALGLPGDPTGLLNLMIACYLLWLVIRIPRWVARTFGGTKGRGAGVLGQIVRVVVVQQLLGAVGLRGGRLLGGTGRTAAAGAGRPAATHLHSHAHANSHLHQHVHLHPPRPGPGGPAPAGRARPARPHPGAPRSAGALPSGAAPPGPPAPARSPAPATRARGIAPRPPGQIPLLRPGWQVGARASGTGWPTPPATPPAGRRAGTGWPDVRSPRPAGPGTGSGAGRVR
jgi:hypothetical protein